MICSSRGKSARRPVSRVLSHPRPSQWGQADGVGMAIPLGRPLPDASCDRPERRRGGPPGIRRCLPLLLGLAPGGVFPAAAVTGGAVRSYRTVSPLPPVRPRPEAVRRCPFCGTFPGVAPAGRYPAPHLRGARTFLPPPERAESGHPTVWQQDHLGPPRQMSKWRSVHGLVTPAKAPAKEFDRCPFPITPAQAGVHPSALRTDESW